MKRNFLTAPVFICALMLAAGCGSEYNGNYPDPDSLFITVYGNVWTYVSLSEGKVVGTGRFGSAEDDRWWATRVDWDVAFCGNLIRTNSGTSGSGAGGIIEMEGSDFYSISRAPSSGYATDRDGVVVK